MPAGKRAWPAGGLLHGTVYFSPQFTGSHFTASQRQALPNGVAMTTLRIPLTTVPAGDGSLVWQVAVSSDNFTLGSDFPTTGGTGAAEAPPSDSCRASSLTPLRPRYARESTRSRPTTSRHTTSICSAATTTTR